MQCEACGAPISLSTAYRDDDGNFVCPDCHTDGKRQAATDPTPEQRRRTGPGDPISSIEEPAGTRQQQQRRREEGAPTPEQSNRSGGTGESSTRRTVATSAQPAQQKFKTLLGLGKFISGAGWVVALLGCLTCLGGGVLFSEGGLGAMAGVMGLTVGMVISALGLLMAASGQQISCFVAIERNTRSVIELLKARKQ